MALGEPLAQHAFELGRRRLAGPPLGLHRPVGVGDRTGELDPERRDRHAGAVVREHRGARPLRRERRDVGQVAGVRTVVADEDVVAAPVQREAEPVAEPPLRQVDHRLERGHLLDRLPGEDGGVGIGDERRPAAEILGGAPELGGGGDRAALDHRLAARHVRVRVDEVPGRRRLLGRPRRPGHARPGPERSGEVLLRGLTADPSDDLAQERVREVRVVPVRAGRERLLGLGEARQKLLAGRHLQRLPDIPRHLALEAREVREQPADRQPVLGAVEMPVEPVVEREPAFVAKPHDPDRRHGLRDRRDPVLVVRRRLLPALDVREPDRLAPDDLAFADARRR